MSVALSERIAREVGPDVQTLIGAARIVGCSTVIVTPAQLGEVLSLFDRTEETNTLVETATVPRWKGGMKNVNVRAVADPKRVIKRSRYIASMGIWANSIARKAQREGIEGVDYKPLPPNGKQYVGGSPLMFKTSDPSVKYVSLIPKGIGVRVEYWLGDHQLPDLRAEEYKWQGVSRVETNTGVKPPPIRTVSLENVKVLAPQARGWGGKFEPIGLWFSVG